jgi:hypothetical protein
MRKGTKRTEGASAWPSAHALFVLVWMKKLFDAIVAEPAVFPLAVGWASFYTVVEALEAPSAVLLPVVVKANFFVMRSAYLRTQASFELIHIDLLARQRFAALVLVLVGAELGSFVAFGI